MPKQASPGDLPWLSRCVIEDRFLRVEAPASTRRTGHMLVPNGLMFEVSYHPKSDPRLPVPTPAAGTVIVYVVAAPTLFKDDPFSEPTQV